MNAASAAGPMYPARTCSSMADTAPGKPAASPAKKSSETPQPIPRLLIPSLSQMRHPVMVVTVRTRGEPLRAFRGPGTSHVVASVSDPRPYRRHDLRGCRQRNPGKRAKSPSVVIHSQPCSMAMAASHASGTRLPLAPTSSQRRRKIRQ